MRAFDYVRGDGVQDVIELLAAADDGAVRPLAGGTDLLTLMKADLVTPQELVDIKRLGDLPGGIEETAQGVALGALTTLAEIEQNPLLGERYRVLAEAAAVAATPQLRNMATLGGNLLQRPRCWYFRNTLFHCWLKGGDECQAYDGENQQHALYGGGPCYAVHPSDLPQALLALDAQVRLRGPQGERTLPIADFYALPTPERRSETTIAPNELILAVELPGLPSGTRSIYLKAMDRKVWAFALVSVAARLQVEEGVITDTRLVLGGVAPIPWRATAAEGELLGQPPTAATFTRAAEAALAGAELFEEWHNATATAIDGQHLILDAVGDKAARQATLGCRADKTGGKGDDLAKEIAIGQSHGKGIRCTVRKAADGQARRAHGVKAKDLGQRRIQREDVDAIVVDQ
jgi:xanthine dehydrogenase YagS FAD-binding subunit